MRGGGKMGRGWKGGEEEWRGGEGGEGGRRVRCRKQGKVTHRKVAEEPAFCGLVFCRAAFDRGSNPGPSGKRDSGKDCEKRAIKTDAAAELLCRTARKTWQGWASSHDYVVWKERKKLRPSTSLCSTLEAKSREKKD